MTPRWTAGVRREVLGNGLTVLVDPVPGSPAAAVVTRVRAGFFDEPDAWAGISHVLEHMFFKGTRARGVGVVARETKAAGGYLNAATSYDYTTYYTVLPARSLPTAVAVQADALRNALLDPDELRREIRVIIEEARRKLDTPGAVAQETLHALLYDRHRIRRWRIGTEEGLARLTRDDVAAYYRSRYVPGRTIVAIAGGVDPEAALALARDAYGDWAPAPAASDPSPAEPPRREIRARTLTGDVRQADLLLGWRSVPALHPDAIPLDVAAVVLAAGRAGRLYRAAREPGLVTSVSAWNYSPTEVGVFTIAAELDPGRLTPALEAFAAEVRHLRDVGPAPVEFERARALLSARWARRFELAQNRASALASAEALAGVDLLEREYERVLALTPEDVRSAAQRHLDPQSAAAVAYVPTGAPAVLTEARLADAFARRAPVRPALPEGPRISPARPRPAPGRMVAGVLHVALPGTDLLVRARPGTPTVRVGVYRTRVAAEPSAQAGLGVLAVRSAVRGAGGYDGGALALAFERLGGTLGAAVSAEMFGFVTTVLSEHLGEAAALLALVLHQPSLGADDVVLERGLLAEDAAQIEDDMYRHPIQLAYSAAFGEHGYGLPLLGRPDTVRALEPEAVSEWHRTMLSAGRTTIVAVGDFEPGEAAATLAARFAALPAATAVDPPLTPPEPGEPAIRHRAVRRDKAQTALAMLFPGPDRRAADRHAAEVWAAVAGGLGGRLFEALRDRRSLAYTVAAYPWQRRTAGGLVTYIATSPDREEEARQAMLAELETFRNGGVSATDVLGAVNYLVGQDEVRRQGAAAQAEELLDAWLHGMGLAELEDPAAPYRAVTADAVREVARRYLCPDRRAEGVVRGAVAPAPSLPGGDRPGS